MIVIVVVQVHPVVKPMKQWCKDHEYAEDVRGLGGG